MENFPKELLNHPKPLAFVLGNAEVDTDIQDKFIQILKEVSLDGEQRDALPLDFRPINSSHVFPGKKAATEQSNTDGILKCDWLYKHYEILPSVIIMLTTFCVDWSAGEWIRREAMAQESLSKLKQSVSGRDVRVLVVAIKTGVGVLDRDVLEERTNSMRRHLQLEGRALTLLSMADFNAPANAQSQSVKKLSKTLRECSLNYYSSQGKKYKNVKKVSSKTSEVILLARYNFKIAFFYEFQGQWPRALRHYRQCHLTLIDLIKIVGEDILLQILAVAQWTNFKISVILIRTNAIKEAVIQIRSHISLISNSPQMKEKLLQQWKLHSWIADQYLMFAQLLRQYNVNSTLPDCERSFYYHNAARHMQLRLNSFNQSKTMDDVFSTSDSISIPTSLRNQLLAGYPGMVIAPSKYIGGGSVLYDPVLDHEHPGNADDRKIFQVLEKYEESLVDKTAQTVALLKQALDTTPSAHKRRRAGIRRLLADQYCLLGNYDAAIANINPSIEHLLRSRWLPPALPLLLMKMEWSLKAGLLLDFVFAAVPWYAYYAGSISGLLSGPVMEKAPFQLHAEVSQLHSEIMCLLSSPSDNAVADVISCLSGLHDSQRWGDYGAKVADKALIESHLPQLVELQLTELHPLMQIDVKMSRLLADIGQQVQVTLTLTSRFIQEMVFSEVQIHFVRDVIVHKVLHSNDKTPAQDVADELLTREDNNNSSGLETQSVYSRMCLVFQPYTPKVLVFSIIVPSIDQSTGLSVLGSDQTIFVERVLFISHYKTDICPQVPMAGSDPTDMVRTDLNVVTISGAKREKPLIALTETLTVNVNFKDGVPNQTASAMRAADADAEYESEEEEEDHRDSLHKVKYGDDLMALNSTCGGSNSTSITRTVIWDVPALAREILHIQPMPQTPSSNQSKQMQSTTRTAAALHTYAFGHMGPSLLQVRHPVSKLELLSPSPKEGNEHIQLLQGAIQRLDITFKTGAEELLDGRIFLSVDPCPSSQDTAFFWIPVITGTSTSTNNVRINPEALQEDAQFHPLTLHPVSMQPFAPFIITPKTEHEQFAIPLFLRSEAVNTFKVKMKVEYRGNKIQTNLSVREFFIDIDVVKPFAINFILSSAKEAVCGADDSYGGSGSTDTFSRLNMGMTSGLGGSFALQGDLIRLATSVACLTSLNGELDLVGLKLCPVQPQSFESSTTLSPDKVKQEIQNNMFQFLNVSANGDCDMFATMATMLRSHLSNERSQSIDQPCPCTPKNRAVSLKRGELFVGQATVLCLEAPNSLSSSMTANNSPPVIEASIGNLEVTWRPRNKELLSPTTPINKQVIDSVDPTVDDDPLCWIPPLDLNYTDMSIDAKSIVSGIDSSICSSRECRMVFSVPPVQVLKAPFDVRLDAPTTTKKGLHVQLRMFVTNRLPTFESLSLQIDVRDHVYALCGCVKTTLEVQPLATTSTGIVIVPLVTGQVSLPRMKLLWSRRNAVVLEVGGGGMARCMFVYPHDDDGDGDDEKEN